VKLKEIEVRQLKEFAVTYAAPTLGRHINSFGHAAAIIGGVSKAGANVLKTRLEECGELMENLYQSVELADKVLAQSASEQDIEKRARQLASKGVEALEAMRVACDRIEEAVDNQLWPLPKYREMLFLL